MLGIRNLLAGESIARYMIWDAMRGLDLLESRPEVDRTRLGVTGCSGGGTLTVYLAALDPRIRAAAPACYVTSWEEQLPGTGPQDAEQQFPDQFRAGINHADLLALAAPTPYLICSSTEDFFPLEGARRTVAEARTVWQAYGAADRLEWFSEPGGHGIYRAGRERVYAWMRRWLRGEDGAVRPRATHPGRSRAGPEQHRYWPVGTIGRVEFGRARDHAAVCKIGPRATRAIGCLARRLP